MALFFVYMNFFKKIKNLVSVKKSYYGAQFTTLAEHKLDWNTTNYLKAYETSPYVFACVKKRSEKVGQIQFKLFRGDKEVVKDDLLNLLYKPNKNQTKNEFFETYQMYKDLAGSTFIYLIREGKKVTEMHNLRPDFVTVVVNKDTGTVDGYKYKVAGGGKELVFEPEEVIASHYCSPLGAYKGQSMLKAAALTVYTEQQLNQYHANVLKNGGKVEGLLTYKVESLTDEQIKRIKTEFKKKFAGASKSGEPMVLYGGLEYENLGLTPTELSYIESKKMTVDDLLVVFGIPKALFALDSGSLGSNGYDAAKAIFLSETIKPLQDNLVEKLNEFLVPAEFELKNVDPSPENTEMKLKQVENGIKNYYMTPNEARELMGMERIDGADQLLIPFGLLPQDTTNEEDTANKKLSKKKLCTHCKIQK